ncbi:hypothetical protein GCM10023185_08930 [Hymenobacter saemangeumensis]|uniref:Uncharacterized protein n=1 Tax=Hymenobacter saemangeumensis TaxID=1084522 RepID=A0ABP8I418_9BACT
MCLLSLRHCWLGITILLLGTALAAQAQVERTVSPAGDTPASTVPARPRFYTATFNFSNGEKRVGYMENYTSGMAGRVLCYETLPEGKKWPRIKAVDVTRLKSLEIDGRNLEALYYKGRPLAVLAQPITSGGNMELFNYVMNRQASIPIGAMNTPPVWTGEGREHWYVRLKGGELHKVPKGDKAFAELMSVMFADSPELAARIKAQDKEANFEFLPRLAREYNAYFESRK